MEKHTVNVENVPQFREWLASRGGIAIWRSVNLSNPGASWSAPYLAADGSIKPKPTWQADNKPERVITDAADILVSIPREWKRFHVAVRRGAQGLTLKLTDASSRKVERMVEKAHEETGKPSYYVFDYMTQDCIIMVDDRLIPLNEYQD